MKEGYPISHVSLHCMSSSHFESFPPPLASAEDRALPSEPSRLCWGASPRMERLGRYELLEKLATGGMAEIFRARQWGDGGFSRDVVVKRLHPHLSEQHTVLRDFCHEAQCMADLAHPGLPAIHELRHDDGHWYIAMERLDGMSLGGAQRAEDSIGRSLRPELVFSVMAQLLDILRAVHELADASGEPMGLVHGDLAPENVFLCRDGRVRLIDFGIATDARARQHWRGDGAIRGTTGYIAPESIASFAHSDRRADLFVVGILMYELTTKSRAFPGDRLESMSRVRRGAIPPLSEFDPHCSADLEALVMNLLAPDPADRPHDAAAVARDLRELAADLSLRVGPEVVASHVRAMAPPKRPAPQSEVPPFVVQTQSVLPPAHETRVTEMELDEVLADLDLLSEPPGPMRGSGALSAPHTQTRAVRQRDSDPGAGWDDAVPDSES